MIAVAATKHPELDDWVRAQAGAEAFQQDLILGEYLGREDILGPDRDPDLCCHLFAATRAE